MPNELVAKTKAGGARPGSGRPKGSTGIRRGTKVIAPPLQRMVLKDEAMLYAREAVAVWVEVMRDRDAPAATRVTAAEKVVERAYGKPEGNDTLNVVTRDAAWWADRLDKLDVTVIENGEDERGQEA